MIRIREMNVSNREGSRMLYTSPETRKFNMTCVMQREGVGLSDLNVTSSRPSLATKYYSLCAVG